MQYYYPGDSLKKYIRYITFYQSEGPYKEYLVFPNPGTAMVLSKDLEFTPIEQNKFLSKEKKGNYLNTLHINKIEPVKIIEEGRQEKITIVFEPLGFNHFIPEVLSDFTSLYQPDRFNLDGASRFLNFAKEVFQQTGVKQQLAYIEDYLQSRFVPHHIPFVEEALGLIMNLDSLHLINEICDKLNTSPRHLLRLFKKHIGLSPVEFRNIYQFRYSIQKKMNSSGPLSLKDISYESNYADAAYMVRMYKKFTGINPTKFFDKAEGDNYITISL